MKINYCTTCDRPFVFLEVIPTSPWEHASPEPIRCPFCSDHVALQDTRGWWESFPLNETDEQAWFEGHPNSIEAGVRLQSILFSRTR